MIYSQNLVWKAVFEFCPKWEDVKVMGFSVNLQEALKAAAVEIFLQIGIKGIPSLTGNKGYAALIIQDALFELKTTGSIKFGTKEEYLG